MICKLIWNIKQYQNMNKTFELRISIKMFRYRKPLLFLIHGSDKIKISLNCSIRIVLFSCVLNLKIKGSFQRNRKETGVKGRHPRYDLFFFSFNFASWNE